LSSNGIAPVTRAYGFDIPALIPQVYLPSSWPRSPAYDSGDHLHPNDAGYQAMTDAIDLAKLTC
jgi:lysophospholipase L1-like esterase